MDGSSYGNPESIGLSIRPRPGRKRKRDGLQLEPGILLDKTADIPYVTGLTTSPLKDARTEPYSISLGRDGEPSASVRSPVERLSPS